MAVDKTLIAGAGKAVKRDPDLVKSLGYAKIGQQMFDTFKVVAEEKIRLKKEFDKSVHDFLQKSGENLDESVLMDVMETLEEDRKKYIWGSKKDKLLLKSKMEKMRVEYAKVNDDLNQVAISMENPSTVVNEEFKSTPTGESITGIFNGTNKAVPKDGGEGTTNFQELGYVIINENGEEEWVSRDQVKTIIKENSRDGETDKELQTQIGLSMQFATNGIWTKYNDYNDVRFRNNIKQIVDGSQNLNSLTHHSMAGLDDSFYDNLKNAIKSGNWETIGLTADQIQEYGLVNKDVDGDGLINEEDAEMIASIFVGDMESPVNELNEPIWEYNEKNHRDMISNMFLLHARRQWAETLTGEESWKYDWYYNKGKTPAEIEAEVERRKNVSLLNTGTTVE